MNGRHFIDHTMYSCVTIQGVDVPCIIRNDNEKLIPVNMLETFILSHYPSLYPEELQTKEPLICSYLRQNELDLLNQYCHGKVGFGHPFQTSDPFVRLDDFLEFFRVVQSFYPGVVIGEGRLLEQTMSSGGRALEQTMTSGWMLVQEAIVPYIVRDGIRLVPIGVLRGAAHILMDVDLDTLQATEAERTNLNEMCEEIGLSFRFRNVTDLIPINVLNMHDPSVTVHDLPQENPMEYATALSASALVSGSSAKPQLVDSGPHSDMLHTITSTPPGEGIQQNNTSFNKSQSEYPENNASAFNGEFPKFQNQLGHLHHEFCSSHDGQVEAVGSQNNPDMNCQNIITKYETSCAIHSCSANRHIEPSSSPITRPWEHAHHWHPNGCFNNVQDGTPPDVVPLGSSSLQALVSMAESQNDNSCPALVPLGTKLDDQLDCSGISPACPCKPKPVSPSVSSSASSSASHPLQHHPQSKSDKSEIRIKAVECYGKNISCLLRGRSNQEFALVEAVCRVYFSNINLLEFIHFAEQDLGVILFVLKKSEENSFIQFYGIPTKQLRCNQIIKLKDLRKHMIRLQGRFGNTCEEGDNTPEHPQPVIKTGAESLNKSQNIETNEGSIDLEGSDYSYEDVYDKINQSNGTTIVYHAPSEENTPIDYSKTPNKDQKRLLKRTRPLTTVKPPTRTRTDS